MKTGIWEYLMGASLLAVLFCIAVAVLSIIAWWKLFEKAGEPGWKIFIPVYNAYIQFKICWSTTPFWFWLGCAVLSGIGNACDVQWLYYIFTIGGAVLSIILCVKAAKAFGRSGGFAVGLVFLGVIFECILAFGSSEYVGPNGIPAGGYDAPDAGYVPQAAQAPQAVQSDPCYAPQTAQAAPAAPAADTGYVPQTSQVPRAAQQPIYGYTPPQSEAAAAPDDPPQARPVEDTKEDI